jgi:hypothetical protein
MKILKYAVIASVLLSGSAFAKASPAIDGNSMYKGYKLYDRGFEHLNNSDYVKAMIYMSFVAGVAGTMFNSGVICSAPDITIGQEADIVGNYLREHPAERTKEPPAVLAMYALIKELPCPKADKG